jgi:hypothetical protein
MREHGASCGASSTQGACELEKLVRLMRHMRLVGLRKLVRLVRRQWPENRR